ncbi:S8 family peptidase [Fodinicola acaciae]|uniref:S8 family peptidase n=1 Tax=Fodinicola acaciae TaxID=2681555 RepID=UPI0013D7E398|nr:S8 family serine peptidase [Fodinicola acaciae]
MNSSGRRWKAAAVSAIAAAATVAACLAATTLAQAAKPAGAAAASRTVTLVTGDKVTVLPTGQLRTTAGAGRKNVAFVTRKTGSDISVIPLDALRMVDAGKLDARLFDVTALIAGGYDDAHRSDLPLIIRYDQNSRAARPRLASANVKRDLPSLHAAAVREDKADAPDFWNSVATGASQRSVAPGIAQIWLDGKRKVNLNESVPQIGAPVAWSAGFTGQDVTVAVLDTGIDATHPDFAGKIVASQNFTDAPDTDDLVGHGTHVASTITGSGAASGGKYKGVAPGTKLAIGKVCGDESCDDSAILAGMAWAVQTAHAKVVNLSLGGDDTPGVDPLEAAVNDLSASTGALFVIAAGNHPPGSPYVSSPGSADAALTVAAVSKQDKLADFSNYGPRVGDGAAKPDISAPGVNIVAAKAKNGSIGDTSDNPNYVGLSGTSMATPHVAGAAAILAGEHPGWTGQQIKSALMSSAKPLPDIDIYHGGAGRVDVAKAYRQTLLGPANILVPTQPWPHNDDQPVQRTLTYQNLGDQPATVAVQLDVTGPDGKPAPAGMFALSANSVRIPAGGKADLTLTVKPSVDGPDGRYQGRVVGTSGDQNVSTAFTAEREPESYNVTLHGVGLDGKPLSFATSFVSYQTGPVDNTPQDTGNGAVTVRLPKGRYLLETLAVLGEQDFRVAELDQPSLTVDHDLTVTADFRTAKQFAINVDQPKFYCALPSFDSLVAGRYHRELFILGSAASLYTGNLGPATRPSDYRSMLAADCGYDGPVVDPSATPDPTPDPSGSSPGIPGPADWYHIAVPSYGKAPAGAAVDATRSKMAKLVNKNVRPAGDPAVLRSADIQFAPGVTARFNTYALETPGTIDNVDYFSPDAGYWSYAFMPQLVRAFDPDLIQMSEPRQLHRGTYTETWNRGILGPAFRPDGRTQNAVQRPDGMEFNLRLFSDSVPSHSGFAYGNYNYTSKNHAALYRGGTKVAESTDPSGLLRYPAPAAAGSYRLDADVTQTFSTVSTSVAASWTFASVPTTNADGVPFPLYAMRFGAKLDDNQSARSGRFVIPVYADRQDGAPNVPITKASLEYSTDDGKSWLKAGLVPAGYNRWVAVVTNPASGYVSLRTTATDTRGTGLSQTIIRAYAVR